jgi:hypothetical protein
MSNELTTQNSNGGIAGAEWLTPATMTEGMKLAELMADCTLVPQHLRDKPGDCFPILVQALRWRMDPFAVAQCTAVVRGKLCYEGKLVHAVLISMGAIDGRLSYEYSGQGQNRAIVVTGTPHGGKASSISGTVAQWKTENGNWQKDPDMMLAYRGTRAWARLYCPDAMLGVYTPDEMQEVIKETTAEVVEPVAAKKREPIAPTDHGRQAVPADEDSFSTPEDEQREAPVDEASTKTAEKLNPADKREASMILAKTLFGMGPAGKAALKQELKVAGIGMVQECPEDQLDNLIDGLQNQVDALGAK